MRIDTSSIEGYAEMSAEDKLKALEAFEMDVDYTGYIKKEQFDKTASELANLKKQVKDSMSESERKSAEEAEQMKKLQDDYNALLRKTSISDNKAKLLELGYDGDLAGKCAEACADGDINKVLAFHAEHLKAYEKKLRAEILKETPRPEGGGESQGMTLDKLRKMSIADQMKFAEANPEEYKALYKGEI